MWVKLFGTQDKAVICRWCKEVTDYVWGLTEAHKPLCCASCTDAYRRHLELTIEEQAGPEKDICP